ncbi:SdrD B-like domain-containing protein, partial [Dolosigranulum pigrum]|uniref:SdrD B-like domain-containing protein n=1 Tax=Dolosigranulum pigrum TaxID=29394 RepID=UPI000DC00D85
MVGKNNKQVLREKHANKFKRYALKKLTVGLASVTIGTGLAFATSSTVSADELAVGESTAVVSDKTAKEQSQPDTPYLQEQEEAVPPAEEPQVTEDRISEEKAVKTSEETDEKATESKEVAEEKQADSHDQTEETSDKEETNTKVPQATTTQLAPVVESAAEPVREEQSAEALTPTLSQIDQLPEEFLTYLRDHSDIVDFKNAATIETYANLLQQSYGVEAAKEERIRAIEAAVKEIETTKEQAKNDVVDQTERLIDVDKDSTTPQDQSKETFKKAIQQADNSQIVVESYLKDAGYKAEDIAGILANVDMSLANNPDQLLENIIQAGIKYANEHTQPGVLLANTQGRDIGHLISVNSPSGRNNIIEKKRSSNRFDIHAIVTINNDLSYPIMAGDYFDVKYDLTTIEDVNPNEKTNGENPVVRDEEGNIVAFISDDRTNGIIRYTFTNYIENRKQVTIPIRYDHSIDRAKVKKTGQYNIDYTFGSQTFTLENVNISYPKKTSIPTKNSVPSESLNMKSALIHVTDNKTYQHITYINPLGKTIYNAQFRLVTFSPSTLNEKTKIKVYRVKEPSKLTDSVKGNNFDDTNVFEDVTSQSKFSFLNKSFSNNNQIESGWVNFGTLSETYAVVVDSETTLKEGEPLKGLVGNGAFLRGKDTPKSTTSASVFTSDFIEIDGFVAPAASSIPNKVTYSIGNKVWNDQNKNGIQDSEELGIPDVKVDLVNSNGELVETTRTNNNGEYRFDNLVSGKYFVQFGTPDGFVPTIKNVNNNQNDTMDSDGLVVPVEINNSNNMTIDSGFYRKVYSIGDKVWVDSDKNGIQDTEERGLAGVTVKLVDEFGNVQTTTTKSNGEYRFDNLDEGTYQVIFETPKGYEATKPYQGDNRDQDSNGSTTTIKVTPQNPFFDENRHNPTVDFGLIEIQPEKLYEMTVEDSSFETHIYSEEEYNKLSGKTPQTVEAGKIKKVQSGKDRRVQVLYEHVNPDTLPQSTTDQFVDGFVNGKLVTEAGTFVQRNGQYWREVSRQVLQESQDEIFIYKPVESKDPVVPKFDIEDGKLYVTINGNRQEIGKVTGEPGEPGKTPTFEINGEGHLIAKFENESDKDLGKVTGEPGKPGTTPKVHTKRNKDNNGATVIFYNDVNGNGNYDPNVDTIISETEIMDGKQGKDATGTETVVKEGNEEPGNSASASGVWVTVYKTDADGNRLKDDSNNDIQLSHKFIRDGKDGKTPEVTSETITDEEGNSIGSRTIIDDGRGKKQVIETSEIIEDGLIIGTKITVKEIDA